RPGSRPGALGRRERVLACRRSPGGPGGRGAGDPGARPGGEGLGDRRRRAGPPGGGWRRRRGLADRCPLVVGRGPARCRRVRSDPGRAALMAGNSKRRGATRKPGSKKGATHGSGGKGRRALEGKGPTPKAEDRPYHAAAKRKAAA